MAGGRPERTGQNHRLAEKQPDIFIVELYPFGRSIFGFELDPVLADIRAGIFGAVRTVCSLRDILVEKKDPAANRARLILTGLVEIVKLAREAAEKQQG